MNEILQSATNSCRIYIPEGFNPRIFLPTHMKRHADSVCYFVHILHHQRFMYKYDSTAMIPIKAAYMRCFFRGSRVYAATIKWLIENNILETDNHYIEGRKSKCYRLSAEWRERPAHAYQVTDQILCEKIRAKQAGEIVTHPVHKYLSDWVGRLEFDADSAGNYCNENRLPDQSYPIGMLRSKDLFCKPCPYGRLHTNISSLKSELRQFLSYHGEPLINLDIANSQPLLFCVPLIVYFSSNRSLMSLYNWSLDSSNLYYDLDQYIISFVHSSECTSNDHKSSNPCTSSLSSEGEGYPCILPTPITMELLNSQSNTSTRNRLSHIGLPEDSLRYIKLCEEGKLYEYLMVKGNIESNKRKAFKQDFFASVFFCNVKPMRPEALLFRKLFPSVWQVIFEIKEKDHARLAHILQRTESSLIINRVARRCSEEIPDAPIATIHDSVLTTAAYQDQVYKIMSSEFWKMGLSPTIRIESTAPGKPTAATRS